MEKTNLKNSFEKLYTTNVSDKIEKKNNLSYLSWAWAWAELKKEYPLATYEIKKFNEFPYLYDEKTGYIVFTKITVDELSYEMWLPVMDYKNQIKKNADMVDINKTIMRCLVKNIAMFGLGLYIYAGEDLPDIDKKEEPKENITFDQVKEKIELSQSLEELKNRFSYFQTIKSQFSTQEIDEIISLKDHIKDKLTINS
jgi:hypothetical protein